MSGSNIIPFRRVSEPAEVKDSDDRLQRIRASLDKINKLMADLKRLSQEGS